MEIRTDDLIARLKELGLDGIDEVCISMLINQAYFRGASDMLFKSYDAFSEQINHMNNE